MGDFLSRAALKVVAVDYQQGMLDHLNEQIQGAPCRAAFLSSFSSNELTCEVGTKFEKMSVAQVVIFTAPHGQGQMLAFNYASLALNNSFLMHYLVGPRSTASQNYSPTNILR
jgi:superoxide dismutase, Fe-Mn family